MIPAFFTAVAVVSLAVCWRNDRCKGMTRIEIFRMRMKTLFLVLVLCSLCSKVAVHTYRHFNPPPAAIVGP
ncbi:hypothetical protein [Bradyrhizobium roseum]|uniref:hypothetical protein n=1 Tax=Bradyrhizobium roseum TaxID=3056648 RepID=UPI00261A833A|nr:hypothetical protein [Bradyrhizobium roseus]WKA29622.1 hypothetical protein QUH67_05400 [Bradyrhizobium roseus]